MLEGTGDVSVVGEIVTDRGENADLVTSLPSGEIFVGLD